MLSLFDRSLMSVRKWLSDGAVGITRGATSAAVAAGFAKPPKVWTVYNSVDLRYFDQLPAKNDARAALGLPGSAKLIGQVGQLCDRNGVADLLNLLHLLPEEWHAVYVGDGSSRAGLELTTRQRGLNSRVHFLGCLPDVRCAYAALDAIALLAPYQAFCLMIAEAMAAGVPVFGILDKGEYAEPEYPLVTSDNSVFVPNDSPWEWGAQPERSHLLVQLAGRIVERFQNTSLLNRQVAVARDHIVRRFGSGLQAKEMTQVYYTLQGLCRGAKRDANV